MTKSSMRARGGDVPGRELKKDYRALAEELVTNQGWRYENGHDRGGHPILFPSDRMMSPLLVPTTPGDHRALKNLVSEVRRRGGFWPATQRRVAQER